MALHPNVIAHNGGALTQTFLERGPQGPEGEALKLLHHVTPGGAGPNGRPSWILWVMPPVGDKGTQRTELVARRFEENQQGNIALPTGTREQAPSFAHYNAGTGHVFFSEDAQGLRPALARQTQAGMAELANLKLPAAPTLVDHPVEAAEKNTRQSAAFLGQQASPPGKLGR